MLQDAKIRLDRRRAALVRKHAAHVEEEHELDLAPEADWRAGEEVLHHLTEHEARDLREIDAALSRIEDGSYGVCQACGKPIGTARLDALPEARLCVACANQEARDHS